MGDKQWKKAFRLLYQPPAPRHKQAFLARIQQPERSVWDVLFSQAAYLRPWSWLLSVGIFLAALYITQNQLPRQIWMVSALLPFAALATVTELSRSARCRMEELELSARFSLKTVLLARLTLLGLGNFLLLAVLFPLVLRWSHLPLAETGFYLLCPYCLTSLLCLAITRRFRGGETVYLCAGAAAAVSLLCALWREVPPILPDRIGYALVTLLLLGLTLWEYQRYLHRGEEWTWN